MLVHRLTIDIMNKARACGPYSIDSTNKQYSIGCSIALIGMQYKKISLDLHE